MYEQALWTARVAAATIITAASYYGLRQFLVKFPVPYLRASLRTMRLIHPWIGLTAVLFFPYHAYVMLTTYLPYGMSLKIATGTILAMLLSIQIMLVIILKWQPTVLTIRALHRGTMFMMLFALSVHYFVRLT